VDWALASGVAYWVCPQHEEGVVYVGFEGTTHVVAGFGQFVVDACSSTPQSVDTIKFMAEQNFEVDPGIDLTTVIHSTIGQLQAFGILAPCLTTL